MRENLFIGMVVGLFFFMATAAMTAVAIKYATPGLLWDVILWSGIAGMIATAVALILFVSSQLHGREFWMPTVLVTIGICSIVFGLVWHFSAETTVTDNDYVIYWVDIRDPKNLTDLLPIWIGTRAASPFENVDCWWAPWGSEKNPYPQDATNPYWSIGRPMKVFHPAVRGGTLYGRSISANDYVIESDATFKGLNYHFNERLHIQVQDGVLTQTIDIWRKISGGPQTLVYSGGAPP